MLMSEAKFPDKSKSALSELTSTQKKLILVGISFASFMSPFGMSMLNLSLSEIGAEFSVSAHALAWISTAYLFSSILFLVPMARISDLVGRKKIFLIGMTLAFINAMIEPFVPDFWILVLFRALDGFAMSCVFATSLPILSSIYPPSQRGSVFGINVSVIYLGSTMGPVVGGIVTAHFGWRILFSLLLPLAALGIYMVSRYLKTDVAESKGEPFDKTGTVLYMISIFFLLFGLSNLPKTWAFVLMAIGVLSLPLFIWHAKNGKYPVMQVKLFFSNKRFTRSNFAAFMNYAGTYAVAFFLSLYLQRVLNLPADMAGIVLLAQPALQAIFSPFVGKLSDKTDSRYLSTLGMLILAVGLVGCSALNSETSLIYLIGCEILLGIGFALFSSPNTSAIMNSVDKKDYSSASASLSVMRQSGMVLAMAIAMCSISIFLGSTEMLNPETVPYFLTSMKTTFYIGTALCLIGAVLSYSRGAAHRSDVAGETS